MAVAQQHLRNRQLGIRGGRTLYQQRPLRFFVSFSTTTHLSRIWVFVRAAGLRENISVSGVKLTRWFVNSLLILGVLMNGVVAGLLAALHLYRGAECMAFIELAISIEAALYLMKEKRFAEQITVSPDRPSRCPRVGKR
jgi:hypothetical protein